MTYSSQNCCKGQRKLKFHKVKNGKKKRKAGRQAVKKDLDRQSAVFIAVIISAKHMLV